MSRRAAVVLIALVVLVLGAVALRVWLARWPGAAETFAGLFEAYPGGDRMVLEPMAFSDLPGWGTDALEEAVPVFLRSCRIFAAQADGAALGGDGIAGTAGDWKPACAAAAKLPAGDRAAARRFFETTFQPWAVRNHRNPIGLFTGYYEPLLHGSRKRHGRFTVPIYARPPELVMVDLGRFRDTLKGQRIAGEVVKGDLVPYPDRHAIDAGALAGRKLEIAWVDDPVGVFFLQVQGSGRVRLEDGKELRVGYAAQNGHPYTSVGRELIARGALDAKDVSLQTIRAWLEAHPDQARGVMERNASYVFFQTVQGDNPLGAQGIPLTPGRSLAVDLTRHALGVPVWLVAGAPSPRPGEPDRKLHRLVVAQDTGGAIRGPVRGDVFWGFGPNAEAVAGRMKHRGKMWLLLPKGISPPAAILPVTLFLACNLNRPILAALDMS
ncbi:MAG: rane-bound lytic murein transglycosylase [Acidobacteriota bacterium]|jgi:membrane-bound lytic murein transglycosylase A|nr:rane-bound lytic murein transglycosylase [Acidobacteriota bacterium]